jgi:Flp pilus assembly protein TadG
MRSHNQTKTSDNHPKCQRGKGLTPSLALRVGVPRGSGRDDGSRKQRRGAAAVELAAVLPILVTVLLGATDFGRFSYSAIAVANAARSGAAYGSMNAFTSSSQAAWQGAVQQAAIDELSGSSAFDTSKLTIVVTSTTEGSGLRRVSVQATYPFKTIANWSFVPSSFNLQQTVVMRGIR